MKAVLILPDAEEIAKRIRACRDELTALRKLQRMAKAAEAVRDARERRQPKANPTVEKPCSQSA